MTAVRRRPQHLSAIGRTPAAGRSPASRVSAAPRSASTASPRCSRRPGSRSTRGSCSRATSPSTAGGCAVKQAIAAGIGFDAIFAHNDLSAVGAMQAAARGGRRVPEDIAVVGFDDVPAAAHTEPPLTTVRPAAPRDGSDGRARCCSITSPAPPCTRRRTSSPPTWSSEAPLPRPPDRPDSQGRPVSGPSDAPRPQHHRLHRTNAGNRTNPACRRRNAHPAPALIPPYEVWAFRARRIHARHPQRRYRRRRPDVGGRPRRVCAVAAPKPARTKP